MGGDGGSIPGRADVVKTAGYKFVRNLGGMGYTPNTQIRASDNKFGKMEERNLRYSTCAISQEPLRLPIVACRLGNLYNKEVIINSLLEKNLPSHASHIKSLKDVKECKVKLNSKTGFLSCPVTMVDLEGGIKGYINWKCGCVFSERAVKNVKMQSGVCLCCGVSYEFEDDIVKLILDEDEIFKIREKLMTQKQKKKEKKIKYLTVSENNEKKNNVDDNTDSKNVHEKDFVKEEKKDTEIDNNEEVCKTKRKNEKVEKKNINDSNNNSNIKIEEEYEDLDFKRDDIKKQRLL